MHALTLLRLLYVDALVNVGPDDIVRGICCPRLVAHDLVGLWWRYMNVAQDRGKR